MLKSEFKIPDEDLNLHLYYFHTLVKQVKYNIAMAIEWKKKYIPLKKERSLNNKFI